MPRRSVVDSDVLNGAPTISATQRGVNLGEVQVLRQGRTMRVSQRAIL